jgi:septal ring factor EnvC (AmiA/AmiB activator)
MLRKRNVNKKEMHSIVKLLSLISFLLLSFPAISQSVIVNNGDTLVCIPQDIVREIIVDLEKGDLCEKEKQSHLRDIESLNQVIIAKDGQISNLIDTKNNLNGVIDEKNSQIEKQKKYEATLRRQRKWNLYKGWIGGTVVGTVIGIIISI